MTGAEETDTEVPISEVAPRPAPGWQYVGWAGGVLQVCDDGGGSRATTTEANGWVDDTRTGPGDAGSGGASLATAAELSVAWSGGSFVATRLVEAEGDGDGWHAATVTAAAPAEMAEAAIFPGDADSAGASAGADGASGAIMMRETGQTWVDMGSFDQGKTCIIGGDQREELDGRGTKTTGAEMADAEVVVSGVVQWGIPGQQYVCWVDRVLQVHDGNGGFGTTSKEAGGGVDDSYTPAPAMPTATRLGSGESWRGRPRLLKIRSGQGMVQHSRARSSRAVLRSVRAL